MQCKKCGAILKETDKFCNLCGTPVMSADTPNNNFNNQPINNQMPVNNFNGGYNMPTPNMVYPNNYQQVPTAPKKSNKTGIIIAVVVGGVIFLFAVFALLFFFIFKAASSGDKLVCESDDGTITIYYDGDQITGYSVTGDYSYDLDEQKEYAETVGMDYYIVEFNDWFVNNSNGSCKNNGEEVKKEDEEPTNTNTDTQVVGDESYGYITIPNNWVKFYDVDGTTALQYSYMDASADTYIISLDYFDTPQYSAKDYASNCMVNMQADSSITGVTGATVKIGKNKEYEAYQVYGYYEAENIFLITYWFEAGDGKVHYMALEGPDNIDQYLSIPESFSTKK